MKRPQDPAAPNGHDREPPPGRHRPSALAPGIDPAPGPLIVLIVAALMVFGASALIAVDGTVGGAEQRVFHWINGWPDGLRPLMWVFQLAGVLFVPLVLAGIAFWMRRNRLAIALAAIVPLKLVVEHAVVKQLVHRERPGTTICHLDRACARFRGVPLEGLSFVSGHAVITWSVATLLWPHLPRRWRAVPVVVAMANSVARIYLGAHSPLDLVGGAAVGVVLGAGLLLVLHAVPALATSDRRQRRDAASLASASASGTNRDRRVVWRSAGRAENP